MRTRVPIRGSMRFSGVALLLLVRAGFGAPAPAYAPAGSFAAPAVPWPSALAGIHLGMTEKELLQVRPAAHRFELLGEPEVRGDDPNPLYQEEAVGAPYFDLAAYVFRGGRLNAVTLAATGSGEAFAACQARMIQGALRKWGASPERLLSLTAGTGGGNADSVDLAARQRGALLWQQGALRVVLTFAPEDAVAGRARLGEIGLVLADIATLSADLKASLFNSLVPAPSKEAHLFDLLERRAEAPLFE